MKMTMGAALAAGVFLALAVGAPASSQELSADAVELEVRDALTQFGVAAERHDALIAKNEAGVAWDAMSGESPVSATIEVVDGFEVTSYLFADGSGYETGVEIGREATATELAAIIAEAAPFINGTHAGPSVVQPRMSSRATGISNCVHGTSAGVSYSQGCHIYYHGITASNSFDANYSRWSGGSSAQYIAGSAKFVSATQTASNQQVNTYNGNRIRYSFDTSLAGWGSIPGYLQLQVGTSGPVVTAG